MLRVLTTRSCFRQVSFLNRYPLSSPSIPLLTLSHYSSQGIKKPPQRNLPDKILQKPSFDDFDPHELLNTVSPPAFAIYRPSRGQGMALRCGYAMERVYLHLAREKSQVSHANKTDEELDSLFDWESSTLATMLTLYDISKILAVLEGREQRVELSTSVEGEDGKPIYIISVLLTPAATSATSAATSASAWRPLYTLQIGSKLVRQDPSNPVPPEHLSISLDSGEVYTLMEHLRRSMVKMFGFESSELFDENVTDEEEHDLEETVNKTKNDILNNTKSFLKSNELNRLPTEEDEIKKLLREIDSTEDEDTRKKVVTREPPKPKPSTLSQRKSTLKNPK